MSRAALRPCAAADVERWPIAPEAVLALLGVFEFQNGRVWKRHDFGVMDALHEKGYITDPKGHRESVFLTEEGMALAKKLAETYFGRT